MRCLFYMFLAVIMTGCTTIQVRKTLNDVETYIAEHPDSALVVIGAIDTTDLNTRGLRAHHALLHAMALDKNYIDVTDDSLALKAVNYYQRRGSRKRYARSLYYLALSYYYDKQYDKSVFEMGDVNCDNSINANDCLNFRKFLVNVNCTKRIDFKYAFRRAFHCRRNTCRVDYVFDFAKS